MNDKLKITTDAGELVDAQAPVIISASRSTDIPAFYAKWFINRLKAGYVVWTNPFNQHPMYISFKNTRLVVFWSKNPQPLIPYLRELDERGIHYYFQFTMNDYDREGFEPNVPLLSKRMETFRQLSETIGKEKIIWRFDPLIITPSITPRDLLTKIWNTGNQIRGLTDKLVFSFVDVKVYRKVQSNLVKETSLYSKDNVENAELKDDQMAEIAEGLVKIRERWKSEGWDITLATCAESIDLDKYGIEHNRCIDDELMRRIFPDDKDLMYYLTYGKLPDNSTLFSDNSISTPKQINLKDKGQRKVCGCMISKDIGMYNTCPHHCVYCYANTSKETVKNRLSTHKDENESI